LHALTAASSVDISEVEALDTPIGARWITERCTKIFSVLVSFFWSLDVSVVDLGGRALVLLLGVATIVACELTRLLSVAYVSLALRKLL
jgi:hypothetical protein